MSKHTYGVMHLVNHHGGADWYAACPCGWRSTFYRNQAMGEQWADAAGKAHQERGMA